MKEGSAESIKNEILKRHKSVKALIVQQLKRDKPFAGDKMPKEAQIWALDNLGTEDMQDLINEFGDEGVNKTLGKIYQMKYRGMIK